VPWRIPDTRRSVQRCYRTNRWFFQTGEMEHPGAQIQRKEALLAVDSIPHTRNDNPKGYCVGWFISTRNGATNDHCRPSEPHFPRVSGFSLQDGCPSKVSASQSVAPAGRASMSAFQSKQNPARPGKATLWNKPNLARPAHRTLWRAENLLT
jgi:hypothetical protein